MMINWLNDSSIWNNQLWVLSWQNFRIILLLLVANVLIYANNYSEINEYAIFSQNIYFIFT